MVIHEDNISEKKVSCIFLFISNQYVYYVNSNFFISFQNYVITHQITQIKHTILLLENKTKYANLM